MPRNVRNFWLELQVDGKKSKVATGPVSKDGGFSLSIYMRDKGSVNYVGQIDGRVFGNALELVMQVLENDETNKHQLFLKGER